MSLARDILKNKLRPAIEFPAELGSPAGCVFVKTTDAFDAIKAIDLAQEIGCAPPFERAWYESHDPQQHDLRRAVRVVAVRAGLPLPGDLTEETEGWRQRAAAGGWTLLISMIDGYYPTAEYAVCGWAQVYLDRNGVVVGAPFYGSPPEERDSQLNTGRLMVGMALRVAALMGCKNIAVEELPLPSARNAKRSAGRARPGLRWHRLVVVAPGIKRADRHIVKAGVGEPLIGLHLARGHFKVYTDEAPLFGKFAGRFWWSPHVRGSKERGVVLKDYELRQAPDPPTV